MQIRELTYMYFLLSHFETSLHMSPNRKQITVNLIYADIFILSFVPLTLKMFLLANEEDPNWR